jgi:hypothetical protein
LKSLDFDAQNNFYEFFNLAGIFRKRKINSLKKNEIRPGASDLSQAGPIPAACPGWLTRTGTPPSDLDPTARGLSSPRDSACTRAQLLWLGFGEATLTVGLVVVGGGWIGGGGVQEVRGDQQACMQKVWCSQGVSATFQ